LKSLRRGGVREAVLVVGYEGDRIRQGLREQGDLGLDLEFVQNDDYHSKNGVSLLKAAKYVDRPCLLSMADHLYSTALVRRVASAETPNGVCVLGVDRRVADCFDIDDATKVRMNGHHIVEISKELPHYDALDTGVFRIEKTLTDELDRVASKHGDASLSDGVQALARRGAFWARDVGAARWIDVDTPASATEAERMLRAYGDDLSGLQLPAAAISEVAPLAEPVERPQSLWDRVFGSAALGSLAVSSRR
jgi:choline kinase